MAKIYHWPAEISAEARIRVCKAQLERLRGYYIKYGANDDLDSQLRIAAADNGIPLWEEWLKEAEVALERVRGGILSFGGVEYSRMEGRA